MKFVLTVLSLAIVDYFIIALFHSTEDEKRMAAENKLYEEIYSGLQTKMERLGQDQEKLSAKDDRIYMDIFHAEPPADDPMSTLSIFFGSDSIPDSKLVFYTASKADRLVADAAVVDSLFHRMVDMLKDKDLVLPPMEMPVM